MPGSALQGARARLNHPAAIGVSGRHTEPPQVSVCVDRRLPGKLGGASVLKINGGAMVLDRVNGLLISLGGGSSDR